VTALDDDRDEAMLEEELTEVYRRALERAVARLAAAPVETLPPTGTRELR
jgi:hypothetical protein